MHIKLDKLLFSTIGSVFDKLKYFLVLQRRGGMFQVHIFRFMLFGEAAA